MLEVKSKNRPSNKYNDKLRHKDTGLVVFARCANRRDRYAARLNAAAEIKEQEFELKLDRVLNSLCKEAGIQ